MKTHLASECKAINQVFTFQAAARRLQAISLPACVFPRMVACCWMAGRHEQTDGAIKERAEHKTEEPKLYNVILLNDDYTTMEFVLHILETLFQKSPAEAFRIMMQVHRNGRGLAGVYTFEVAETKADKVATLASEAGYPLRATIEEA